MCSTPCASCPFKRDCLLAGVSEDMFPIFYSQFSEYMPAGCRMAAQMREDRNKFSFRPGLAVVPVTFPDYFQSSLN